MKTPNQWEAIEFVRERGVRLPPLELEFQLPNLGFSRAYGETRLKANWGRKRFEFEVEWIGTAAPKALELAIQRKKTLKQEIPPCLMAPYFAERQLLKLEEESISGLDLCGNGVLVVRGQLLVFRSGQPKKFKQSMPIKNVYRGTSSLIPRTLLACPRFSTVLGVANEMAARRGKASLPTISKVLKRLEEELILSRSRGAVKLLQADKLLDELAANFRPPSQEEAFTGKCELDASALAGVLDELAQRNGLEFIMTGAGSTSRYAVMAREDKLSIYCTNVSSVVSQLGGRVKETTRFPNLELIETRDRSVYFDPRPEGGVPWASPVQVYLELMSGDKRDRETADQVRAMILQEVNSALKP